MLSTALLVAGVVSGLAFSVYVAFLVHLARHKRLVAGISSAEKETPETQRPNPSYVALRKAMKISDKW